MYPSARPCTYKFGHAWPAFSLFFEPSTRARAHVGYRRLLARAAFLSYRQGIWGRARDGRTGFVRRSGRSVEGIYTYISFCNSRWICWVHWENRVSESIMKRLLVWRGDLFLYAWPEWTVCFFTLKVRVRWIIYLAGEGEENHFRVTVKKTFPQWKHFSECFPRIELAQVPYHLIPRQWTSRIRYAFFDLFKSSSVTVCRAIKVMP